MMDPTQIRHSDFRSILPFSNQIPYGFELEYGYAPYDTVAKRLHNHQLNHIFTSKRDSTVTARANNRGGEIASSILYNQKETWENLLKLLYILKTSRATVTDKTSLQISLDRSIFKNSKVALTRFLKLWVLYEEEIYYMSFGENLKARRLMHDWAIPCGDLLADYVSNYLNAATTIDRVWQDLFDILHGKLHARYYGLNVDLETEEISHGLDRIEIRTSNSSLNEFIIQNTIYFFVSLANCCHDESIDWDRIEKEYWQHKKKFLQSGVIERQNHNDVYRLHGYYQSGTIAAHENLKKALSLQELLYRNELDKTLFMKQYTKKL